MTPRHSYPEYVFPGQFVRRPTPSFSRRYQHPRPKARVLYSGQRPRFGRTVCPCTTRTCTSATLTPHTLKPLSGSLIPLTSPLPPINPTWVSWCTRVLDPWGCIFQGVLQFSWRELFNNKDNDRTVHQNGQFDEHLSITFLLNFCHTVWLILYLHGLKKGWEHSLVFGFWFWFKS